MLTQKLLQDLLVYYFLEKEVLISAQVQQLIDKLNRIEAFLEKRQKVQVFELKSIHQGMISKVNSHAHHVEQVQLKTYTDLKVELQVLKQELESIHSKFIEIE